MNYSLKISGGDTVVISDSQLNINIMLQHRTIFYNFTNVENFYFGFCGELSQFYSWILAGLWNNWP